MCTVQACAQLCMCKCVHSCTHVSQRYFKMTTLGSYKTSKEKSGGPCRKPASFQSQTTVQSFQRRCQDSDSTGKVSPLLPGSARPLGWMTHHPHTHPPPHTPAFLGDEPSPRAWHLKAGGRGHPAVQAPARAATWGSYGAHGEHAVCSKLSFKRPWDSFGAGSGGCSPCLRRSPETTAGTLAGSALPAGRPPFL